MHISWRDRLRAHDQSWNIKDTGNGGVWQSFELALSICTLSTHMVCNSYHYYYIDLDAAEMVEKWVIRQYWKLIDWDFMEIFYIKCWYGWTRSKWAGSCPSWRQHEIMSSVHSWREKKHWRSIKLYTNPQSTSYLKGISGAEAHISMSNYLSFKLNVAVLFFSWIFRYIYPHMRLNHDKDYICRAKWSNMANSFPESEGQLKGTRGKASKY